MKAIRKSDGKEIEVRLLHPCEYVAVEPDADYPAIGGRSIIRADDLIIDEPVDWAKFRREAAKDIVCARIIDRSITNKEELCEWACKVADTLVKQLKKQ